VIGETIGNFRLVERLGRGGMGEVYRAEHKDLQTPVAVKLLNSDISEDRDHVQRFFNEARIVSKIKSSGTVKIFDSGFHKEHAYLIMELLDGESLARRVDQGPMPADKVIELARQIASVLDATHRQGVIHRDLKPDNIFLVHDDERASGERIKILDFGIAKLSGGTISGNSPKTSGTMGTPAYMAPEQWSDSSQVDWRADAYSLGCVMFEMACGRPPFIAASIPEAYTKHAHGKPPEPRSLAPDLPPDLDALILRLLAKDPADRCVSMGQVTRELEAIGNGTDPSKVLRESRPMRAEPRAQSPLPSQVAPPTMTTLGASAAELQITRASRRPALVGGIVAGVAVLGVLVFVMTRGSGSDKPVQPAVAPVESAPAASNPVVPPPAPPAPIVVQPPPPAVEPPKPAPPTPVEPPKPPPAIVHHAKPPVPPKPPVVVTKPDAGVAKPPPPPGDDLGGRL
jgi:eukaryotic-like serine/threonine-protein kinase